ncbi:MAG: hypothetical protein Q8P68_04855 [Candidatus Peregrinibacteria bacterium]|nr:hypothetical protein [Candidatus Peregrinibacteria bacterium]
MQQIYKTTGSLSVDEKNIMRFVIEKMKMLQDKLLQKYGPQGDIDEYLHDKIDLEKYLLVKYIGVSSIQGNIERMQSFLQSTYK